MNKAIAFLHKSAQDGVSPESAIGVYKSKGFMPDAALATAKEHAAGFGKFGQVQAASTAMHLFDEHGILELVELGARAQVAANANGETDAAKLEERVQAILDGASRDLCAILVEATNASGWSAKLGKKAGGTSTLGY